MNTKLRSLLCLLVLPTLAFAEKDGGKDHGKDHDKDAGDKPKKEAIHNLKARIDTDKGVIELELFASQTPMTVANFVNLAERGYYDGLNFHRVIAEFMIQGGCPQGTGTGDPGYRFPDEIDPKLKHNKPGILSMANAGPATNGSQFFITHVPTPHLDGRHTVFGHVTKGQDVVNSIAIGDKINQITIEGDTTKLFESQKDNIDRWNRVLDERFPRTRAE